ncbi:MAG: transketolase [Geminicoccaceae bacterium]|jgi:transketolase|nr:MAG: transketolase [Geminicoccaceae bacterium]
MSGTVDLRTMANAIRALAMDAVEKAKSGHPGMPMGMADVATVLWTRFLTVDPADPAWPDRDRFVLSAGHGSMLLYALLHLAGFPKMDMGQIERFRQLHSLTPGHPEYGHTPGVETTTGPLGQGLANAFGMALAERMLAARFGPELVDHWTWVVAGDGCLMEGISHEAAALAGHLGLGRLIVLFDDNGISIDGPTKLATSEDVRARFAAYGWHTLAVDGHDPEAVARAIEEARADPRPSLVACRTIIGYGAPNKQGSESTHGAPLGAAEVAAARERLGWHHPPFVIPEEIYAAWRAAMRRGGEARAAWKARLEAAPAAVRAAFVKAIAGEIGAEVEAAIAAHKAKLFASKPTMATRKASEAALEALTEAVPELVGGSADLTHSNNTITKATKPIRPGEFGGRYVHYGVREHAMAAIMNGIALHEGLVPYGGTFLVFSDYCRNSIRLSALMGLRVVYVMTHDSIGLGEDGPTHQPVEHLASLRAIPNLLVFRPADAVETAECWELALSQRKTPSILALTRQNVPAVRTEPSEGNLCAKGGYVLAEATGGARALTILATGSEVHLALEARARLEARGVPTAVVSLPCFELFDAQPPAYRATVLGEAPRIAIEAASPFGWARYVGSEEDVVAVRSFGASAPAADLFRAYGITVDALVSLAERKLGLAPAA